VAQKGSLVAPDRLRFDFSHPKPMTREEIARVEDIANDAVLQNAPVVTRLMAVDDAIASGDPAALTALSAELGTQDQALSDAVAANTPPAPSA
jgi:alanyl-tRNA synthetase